MINTHNLPDDVNNSSLFIGLCWEELFSSDTPLSHQPHLLDSPTLLKELYSVSTSALTNPNLAKNITDIVAELKYVSSIDCVLPIFFPELNSAIASLPADISPSKAAVFSEYALSLLQDYHKLLIQVLKEKAKALPRKKEDTYLTLSSLATHALLEKSEPELLLNITSQMDLSKNVEENLKLLLSATEPNITRWTCYIAVTGEQACVRSLMSRSDFILISRSDKPLGKTSSSFFEQNKGAFFYKKEVQAYGPKTALQESLSSLTKILDLSNLYFGSQPISLSKNSLVCFERTQFVMPCGAQASSSIEPAKAPLKSFHDLLSNNTVDSLPPKLTTALEQYSVALASNDPKVRFTNLWVALETIANGHQDGSIIKNICDAVIPILASKRISSITKNHAVQLSRHQILDNDGVELILTRSAEYKKISKEELFLLLSGYYGKNPRKELYRILSANPLLVNRSYLLHNKLSDPKKILAEINMAEKTHKWNIKRIYRARNLLFHSGEISPLLNALSTNLHYYFLTVANASVDLFKKNPLSRPQLCFEEHRINLDYLKKNLMHSPEKITVQALFTHAKFLRNVTPFNAKE